MSGERDAHLVDVRRCEATKRESKKEFSDKAEEPLQNRAEQTEKRRKPSLQHSQEMDPPKAKAKAAPKTA